MADAPEKIWLQRPCRDPENEWFGEVTWCYDKINDDDTEYIRADVVDEMQLAYAEEWQDTLKEMCAVVAAAKNLVAQKGRHNTEIAYKRLADALTHNE